jgi:hypothetical protein
MRNFFISEDISTSTANSASADTILTNSSQVPLRVRLRNASFDAIAGNTSSSQFVFVRRVPAGYTAPATITVATGSASTIDSPDVMAYGFTRYTGSEVGLDPVPLSIVKPMLIFYPGDLLVIQGVVNVTSTGAGYSALLEYDVATTN